MKKSAKNLTKSPATYITLALCWLAMGAYFGRSIVNASLNTALIGSIVFSIPIFSAAIYSSTVRKIYRQLVFNPGATLRPFLIRRTLSSIWWGIWSIVSALCLLLYFGRADELEWIVFLAALSFFFLVSGMFGHVFQQNFKPFISVQISLSYARATTAFIGTGLYLIMLNLSTDYQDAISLDDALQTAKSSFNSTSPSPLVRQLALLLDYHDGLKQFAIGNIRSFDHMLYVAFVFAGSLTLFYNAMLAFSGCLTPLNEYRRVVGRLDENDAPPGPAKGAIGTLVFSMIVSISFCFFVAHKLDSYLLPPPPPPVTVESIGDRFFAVGTVEKLHGYDTENRTQIADLAGSLYGQSHLCHLRLQVGVDSYINWYKQLLGERPHVIDKRLSPDYLNSLKKEFRSHLSRGAVCNFMYKNKDSLATLERQYNDGLTSIINGNTVHLDPSKKYLVRSHSSDVIPSFSNISGLVEMRSCYSGLFDRAGVTKRAVGRAEILLTDRQSTMGTVFYKVANGVVRKINGGSPYPAANFKTHINDALREAICIH